MLEREPEAYLLFARPDVSPDDVDAVRWITENGWITSGPEVARFEAEFRLPVGASHAVALNSCTRDRPSLSKVIRMSLRWAVSQADTSLTSCPNY